MATPTVHEAEAVMRDGTVLRADIHRPPHGAGPWPVLLARCPYGRRDPGILDRLAPAAAARRGWLVVVQDTRGRFASDGDWEPLVHEYADGYDTVRWAARLPGGDGRVAMYGPSYLGHAQWAALTAGPPELVAAVPEFTWDDPYDGLLARGGAPELGLVVQWTLGLGHDVLARRYAHAPARRTRALRELTRAQNTLDRSWTPPVLRELPVPGRPGGPPLRPRDPDRTPPRTPTLTVAGWYDAFLQGSLDHHIRARAAGHRAGLIVGPWTHADQGRRIGDTDFGPAADAARIDGGAGLRERALDWLDGVLGRGPAPDPAALVFVMGTGTWRRLDRWPPDAAGTAWYLRAGGALSPEPPSADEAPAVFHHDPADPVPTLGGALLLTPDFPAGPADQRPVEERPDVLVYTGAPLSDPLEVIGRVRVTLAVSATAGPADWVVRLCDVAPDGVSRNLTDGILRTTASGPAEITVDLWSTAHVFRPGHALRLQVAASCHPRWAAGAAPATRTVLHTAARPSRLVLPVVR
ncbi:MULTISPECIES: CocE/NonD family hydrolase [unclassified Streptomyces]|uniref:CocE/NonD family hydrolase n=1 Tax=unclassified Streptomyces TaxID=2593676 RepID=UPI002E2D88D4|nr:CocE/NonD family hydrolase [Streptomyces sp. NBC_00223]